MSEVRKSDVRGVIWDGSRNRWRVYVTGKNGKRVFLGTRKTKEEAEKLRFAPDAGTYSPEQEKKTALLNRAVGIRMRAVWREVTKGDHGWSSFDHFVATVGDRPQEERKLVTLNPNKPLGPDNFQWVKPVHDFMTASGRKSYSKQRYAADPLYYRRAELKRKFNITLEQYEEMLSEQNGGCAICGQPETAVRKNRVLALAVDHNHRTGENRGLLCTACNIGIGSLAESPERLRSAIAYVEKWNARETAPLPDNVVKLKQD